MRLKRCGSNTDYLDFIANLPSRFYDAKIDLHLYQIDIIAAEALSLMTKFIWNEVILNSEEDDYYGYDSYEYDKIFFVGFINNCKSYSINVPIKNLTGNELVGNDRLEKLTLNSGFLSTPVIFTSLGLVKTLEFNKMPKKDVSVFFEDSALMQIEEIKFKSGFL